MEKEDLKLLNLLASLPLLAQKLEPELQDAAVQKRFTGNVYLLMGLHDMPANTLAKQSGCDVSTLSRMLNPKPNSPTKSEGQHPDIRQHCQDLGRQRPHLAVCGSSGEAT